MDLSRATALCLLLTGCFGDVELQKPHDPPAWPMGQARPDPHHRAQQDVAPTDPAVVETPPGEVAPVETPPAPPPPVQTPPAPAQAPPPVP